MKKFALVGCGQIGKQHAERINEVGELVAVCDINRDKAEGFATNRNVKAYDNIDDLLANEKEVEVVSICTPNGLHAEHVIKSLQARKHVLCEEPLCLTASAAWQINETEKFCRRRLFVVRSALYIALLQKLRQALADGSLGKVYSFHLSCLWSLPEGHFADWKGKLFPGGGHLYTQFSYHVDALILLFGEVAETRGFGGNRSEKGDSEMEDIGTVALKMQTGAIGSLHWSVNTDCKNGETTLTILTDRGSLRLCGEYLDEIQYSETETPFLFDSNKRDSSSSKIGDQIKSIYTEVYLHLLGVLDNNHTPSMGALQVLKTVETIEKIYKAIS